MATPTASLLNPAQLRGLKETLTKYRDRIAQIRCGGTRLCRRAWEQRTPSYFPLPDRYGAAASPPEGFRGEYSWHTGACYSIPDSADLFDRYGILYDRVGQPVMDEHGQPRKVSTHIERTHMFYAAGPASDYALEVCRELGKLVLEHFPEFRPEFLNLPSGWHIQLEDEWCNALEIMGANCVGGVRKCVRRVIIGKNATADLRTWQNRSGPLLKSLQISGDPQMMALIADDPDYRYMDLNDVLGESEKGIGALINCLSKSPDVPSVPQRPSVGLSTRCDQVLDAIWANADWTHRPPKALKADVVDAVWPDDPPKASTAYPSAQTRINAAFLEQGLPWTLRAPGKWIYIERHA